MPTKHIEVGAECDNRLSQNTGIVHPSMWKDFFLGCSYPATASLQQQVCSFNLRIFYFSLLHKYTMHSHIVVSHDNEDECICCWRRTVKISFHVCLLWAVWTNLYIWIHIYAGTRIGLSQTVALQSAVINLSLRVPYMILKLPLHGHEPAVIDCSEQIILNLFI